jgi:hypothetical protein
MRNRTIIALVVIFVAANVIRDAGIQSDRNAYARAVAGYEQSVTAADQELSEYEEEAIGLANLDKISKQQKKVKKTSKLLIGLNTNTYSGARTYNKNIGVYQSQMSKLNRIIGSANRRYEMNTISSPELKVYRTRLSGHESSLRGDLLSVPCFSHGGRTPEAVLLG